MAHPAAGAQVRQRFERQLEANGIPAEAWAAEWGRELASLADSSTYLSGAGEGAAAGGLQGCCGLVQRGWGDQVCLRGKALLGAQCSWGRLSLPGYRF